MPRCSRRNVNFFLDRHWPSWTPRLHLAAFYFQAAECIESSAHWSRNDRRPGLGIEALVVPDRVVLHMIFIRDARKIAGGRQFVLLEFFSGLRHVERPAHHAAIREILGFRMDV